GRSRPRSRRRPRRRPRRRAESARSRDDVWDESGAQARDLVLQQELALLQTLELQAILPRIEREAVDHVVQVVMLDLERLEPQLDLRALFFGQRKVGHPGPSRSVRVPIGFSILSLCQ